MSSEKFLLEMEKRFKATCNIKCDTSIFPIRSKATSIATNKSKSKEFSEVFTPLWLVDQMIKQVDFESSDTTTLDLCSGYGQFSIRLMRYYYNNFPYWDIRKFLINNHAFSELQLSSCYKLLNIFSNKITLFIGNSTYLNKLPANAKGLWCYIETYGYWVCLTKTIQDILSPNGIKQKSISEKQFISSIELIIKNLNETYSIMKETYTKKITTSEERLLIIGAINDLSKDSEGKTLVKVIPPALVSEMLDRVEDLEKKSILVLYNCEILEELVKKKKIDPKNITFGADFNCVLKTDMMKKIYGVDTISFSGPDFLHNSFKGRKFDVCLSNPPYNDVVDLKIIDALLGNASIEQSIAREFIIVHPSTWLIDLKGKLPIFDSLKNRLAKKIKSVKLFNGNLVFDINLFVPALITHIDLSHNSDQTNVLFFNDKFIVNNVNDITKFGSEWIPLVKPFMKVIKTAITNKSDIWNNRTKTVVPEKHYCQLSRIRGNVSKDKSQLVSDDFYTMVMKNLDEAKGIRFPMDKRPGPTFGFNSEIERDNFLQYLTTDFARFCFSFLKNKSDVDCGELGTIPWMNFAQSWDDEKLFKHFDVSQKMQDYIRKFLPDYYGIRK